MKEKATSKNIEEIPLQEQDPKLNEIGEPFIINVDIFYIFRLFNEVTSMLKTDVGVQDKLYIQSDKSVTNINFWDIISFVTNMKSDQHEVANITM